MLDAEIILPEYSDVGNAAGAVAAKGIRRVDFLIRPASLATLDWEFFVFSEHVRNSFLSYREAVDYATSFWETMVKQYMEDAGLDSESFPIDVQKNELTMEGMANSLETKLMVLGHFKNQKLIVFEREGCASQMLILSSRIWRILLEIYAHHLFWNMPVGVP